MKSVLTLLFAAWASTAPAPAQAQEPILLSLKEAQEMAIDQAYAVRQAKLNIEAARRTMKEMRAMGLPQVNASLDYTQYLDIPTQVVPSDAFGFPNYLTNFFSDVAQETGLQLDAPAPDPNGVTEMQFGAEFNSNIGIQATQVMFSGSWLISLKASQAYSDSRTLAVERTKDEVRKLVADAYATALALGANENLMKEALKLAADGSEEMRRMNAEGFVDVTRSAQLELTVHQLEQEVRKAEGERRLMYGMLAFHLGLHAETPLVLTDGMDKLLAQDAILAIGQAPFDVTALPVIREHQTMAELAGLNVQNKRAGSLPVISAFYSSQQNAQRGTFDFFDPGGKWYPAQLWGLKMTMPVWTSLGRRHTVAKARVEQEQATLALEQMTAAAGLAYNRAKIEWEQAEEGLLNATRSAELAVTIREQVTAAWEEGVASSMEWTAAHNQWIQAEGARVAHQLALIQSRTALRAAKSEFE